MNLLERLFAALPKAAKLAKLAKLTILTAPGTLASQPILAHACDCFPPAPRIKAAQDALQTAHVAVYGQVVAVFSAAQSGPSHCGSAEVLQTASQGRAF